MAIYNTRVGLLSNMPFDKKLIAIRDFWHCQTCGKKVDINNYQIAHKIKQDKTQKGRGSVAHVRQWLLDKYGLDMTATEIVANIINHPYNVCVTCSSSCNDEQNLFNKPVPMDRLLEKIMKDLHQELKIKK